MSVSRDAATEVVMDEMEERGGMATEQILHMGLSENRVAHGNRILTGQSSVSHMFPPTKTPLGDIGSIPYSSDTPIFYL